MRVLFICKKNECYGFQSYARRSSGLFNSTKFIVDGLRTKGVHADIIEVIDNNCIDREVAKHKPDIVIIEALWVVPEKFDILKKLHPTVKWFIHMHSGIPFLAIEGIAMEWLPEYAERGVGIIANSTESFEAFESFLPVDSLTYLHNVYISKPYPPIHRDEYGLYLKVGCFGAMRPMKNHLLQAMAAIQFAEGLGKRCLFFVNATRVETGGEPVLKNLRYLFAQRNEHELIECPWMEQDEFHQFLRDRIDIGMQVSLTETFNVVTADYLTAGLPVVVSKEVKWVSSWSMAQDDSIESIVKVMRRAYRRRFLILWNQKLLHWNSEGSQAAWLHFVRSLNC